MAKSDTFSTPAQNTSAILSAIRAVSPITVDGGTRFVAHLTKKFAPVGAMREMLRSLRSGPIRRDFHLGAFVGEPFDTVPTAHVTVSGAHRHILTFYIEDQCWFRWNDETRDLHVQLKAKGLWAYGYDKVMPYWLGNLARLFTGRIDEDAIAELFKCTGLELCCDFVGLQFYRADAANFLGAKLNGDSGLPVDVWSDEGSQAVETINVGRRTANLSLCIYDKLAQIESVKHGDHSTYEATHRAHGWDGSSKIVRVEMRFAKEGMVWENDGLDIDLSNPWTLCDGDDLGMAWSIGCLKRRLIVPDTATRRERCVSDERWRAVALEAMTEEPRTKWRQKRQVQKDTHRERVKRARRGTLQSILRYAALHDLRSDEYADDQLAELIADVAFGADFDFAEYQRRYARTQLPLLGEEIRQAAEAYRDRQLSRSGPPLGPPRKRRAGKTGADLARAIGPHLPPKA